MTKWTFLYSKLPYGGTGWSVAQRLPGQSSWVSLPGWLGPEKPRGWEFFCYVNKGDGWKAGPQREFGRHSKWSFQS